jgi:hypothetical protein
VSGDEIVQIVNGATKLHLMTATPQPTEHLRGDVEDPRTMG